MSELTTAKEALLVEAIGDFGRLLDRVDVLQSALKTSTHALVAAETRLADQLAVFDSRVTQLTEHAKVVAVKHIATRTDEAARRLLDEQSRVMAEAGREVFRAELGPALQRLGQPLREWVQRLDRPWDLWLTHAATAGVTAAVTLAITAWIWLR